MYITEDVKGINLKRPSQPAFFIPEYVILPQLIDTTGQLSYNHPAQIHNSAASEIAGALMEGIPCLE